MSNQFSSVLNRKRALYAALIILSSFLGKNTIAQGDLLLYPKRIVFEGNKKSQVLNISNTGKDTVRFFISVIQVRMKADGAFETIAQPDSGQYFADKNFRFFPRNVVLAPNESQAVKMQVINIHQLAAGEYRSHLYFRAEPDKKPLGEDDQVKDSTQISVKLVAVFGISIPVIIRVGEKTCDVSFSDLAIQAKDGHDYLHMTLSRKGNVSAYGDIFIDHVSPSGKVTRIGAAKGLAIYTPNPTRRFTLPLEHSAGVDMRTGKLKVSYLTPADARAEKIAETEMDL